MPSLRHCAGGFRARPLPDKAQRSLRRVPLRRPRLFAGEHGHGQRRRDKNGHMRNETVIAMVGLDNLYAEDNPSREVRMSYGEPYLDQFAQSALAPASRNPASVVKTKEPAD